ncbi:EFR1 family ferrodoxin [Candidatus Omnitrophota bacterium]
MKIKIGYFTSTGNTLWLALKAKDNMESAGHTVKLFEIVKEQDAFSAEESDMTGFFYPVWGSNPPDPMVEYLNNMPEGRSKIFFVGNCCAFTGDTGLIWKNALEKKGYDVFYLDHIIMPTNMNIPWLPENAIKKVPVGEELEKILSEAQVKLLEVCDSILKREEKVEGGGPISRLGGFMQRKFYWTADWYKSRFLVDKEKCVKCGLCYRVCPTGNISRSEEGEISFNGKCILCVKCFNLCPVNAVLITNKSLDDEKYRRYKGPSREIKPVEYRQ